MRGIEGYEGETPVESGSAGKEGELRLVFDADADGRSFVAEDYARVPFHLGRGMYPDPERDDLVFVYVQNPTGATVQGDRMSAEVVVRESAAAHVTTGSAEKVHTMDAGHAEAETTLRVEEDGYLEYVPDPTILHDGARYETITDVRVADGGAAVLSDVVVGGRLAHGEGFGFDAYASSVRAHDGGSLLFDDTVEILGEDHRRTALFDGNPVFGDLYVVAPSEETETLRDAVSDSVGEAVGGDEDVVAGTTALPNSAGAVVRFAAGSARGARRAKRAGWDAARRRLADAPVPPRRR